MSLTDYPRFSKTQFISIPQESSDDKIFDRIADLNKIDSQASSITDGCDVTPLLNDDLVINNELMSIEESDAGQILLSSRVIVLGKIVNVCTRDMLESNAIAQVYNSNILELDMDIFSLFSDQKRTAVEQNDGWFPTILPNDQKGYIYSLYTE